MNARDRRRREVRRQERERVLFRKRMEQAGVGRKQHQSMESALEHLHLKDKRGG